MDLPRTEQVLHSTTQFPDCPAAGPAGGKLTTVQMQQPQMQVFLTHWGYLETFIQVLSIHFHFLGILLQSWTLKITLLPGVFTLGRSTTYFAEKKSGQILIPVVVVQVLSCVQLFVTPRTAAHQALLFFIIFWSLLKLTSTESVISSNHLILCCPLCLLPSTFPSIRVFSHESVLPIRWPKYWSFSFSFSINPSNERSGLIFFRIDWLDLLEVQGTLKSLLLNYSSKALTFCHPAFFMVQLSHSYIHIEKP